MAAASDRDVVGRFGAGSEYPDRGDFQRPACLFVRPSGFYGIEVCVGCVTETASVRLLVLVFLGRDHRQPSAETQTPTTVAISVMCRKPVYPDGSQLVGCQRHCSYFMSRIVADAGGC